MIWNFYFVICLFTLLIISFAVTRASEFDIVPSVLVLLLLPVVWEILSKKLSPTPMTCSASCRFSCSNLTVSDHTCRSLIHHELSFGMVRGMDLLFVLGPCSFNCYSFIICFETRHCDALSLIFLAQVALAILSLWWSKWTLGSFFFFPFIIVESAVFWKAMNWISRSL